MPRRAELIGGPYDGQTHAFDGQVQEWLILPEYNRQSFTDLLRQPDPPYSLTAHVEHRYQHKTGEMTTEGNYAYRYRGWSR